MTKKLSPAERFEGAFGVHPDRVHDLDLYAKEELLDRVLKDWLVLVGDFTRQMAAKAIRIQIGSNRKYIDDLSRKLDVQAAMRDPALAGLIETEKRKAVGEKFGISADTVAEYCPTGKKRGRPNKDPRRRPKKGD